jgi:hypothetical protein
MCNIISVWRCFISYIPYLRGAPKLSKQFTELKWYSYMSLHLLEMQYTLSLMTDIMAVLSLSLCISYSVWISFLRVSLYHCLCWFRNSYIKTRIVKGTERMETIRYIWVWTRRQMEALLFKLYSEEGKRGRRLQRLALETGSEYTVHSEICVSVKHYITI